MNSRDRRRGSTAADKQGHAAGAAGLVNCISSCDEKSGE